MRKFITIISLIIILLLNIQFSTTANIENIGKTIYVDDDGGADFTKIQDAINASEDGDTVFVYSGTYYENLLINKSVELIGEYKETTIIDGQYKDTVVYITKDFVNIAGFTIQNSGVNVDLSGLYINSNFSIIKQNIIRSDMEHGNAYGIFLINASYNTIDNNIIEDNYQSGIHNDEFQNLHSPLHREFENQSLRKRYFYCLD